MTIQKSNKLIMGSDEMELGGKYLSTLREANDLLDDPVALRARMADDGYLLIRGLQDPNRVRAARQVVLDNLAANGQVDPEYPLDQGVVVSGK